MGGLARLCKRFGQVQTSSNGKTIIWYYDHVNEKPRNRDEMTDEEWGASEKKKWTDLMKK